MLPAAAERGDVARMTVVADISVSLDGLVTVLNDPPTTKPTGGDKQVLSGLMEAGASGTGRRMYDVSLGLGGDASGGVPCIVVIHRVDDQPDTASGFELVEAAIRRAPEIAGDKPVSVGGGASIIDQALKAGLVDELAEIPAAGSSRQAMLGGL